MPVTVIVGGQFGSEGKGKTTNYLAGLAPGPVVVRCGGPNSGHTIYKAGAPLILRQVPCGVLNPTARLLIAPGALVDPEVLMDEIHACALTPERLGIDSKCVIISERDKRCEREAGLGHRISSTLSGTGSAVARKVWRDPDMLFAKDTPCLRQFVVDVMSEVNHAHDRGGRVIIEGTQGFGLSLHHGQYPYVTSRDTTAAGFLSEAGVSPVCVDQIVLVIRTFPIRVGGPSGHLRNEISWEDLRKVSGYPHPISEHTSVTHRLRRVARFDWEIVLRAVTANRPTAIALHGVDYLSYRNYGAMSEVDLTDDVRAFIGEVESRTGTPVRLVFTGLENNHLVDRWPTERPETFHDQEVAHVRSASR